MPLYEYRCQRCRRKFTNYVALSDADSALSCPTCGGAATKLVTGCAFHRSEAARIADFEPRDARRTDFFRDPFNVGLAAKQRLRDRGIDLSPRVEEIVERGRSGQILDDVR